MLNLIENFSQMQPILAANNHDPCGPPHTLLTKVYKLWLVYSFANLQKLKNKNN